MKRINTKLHTLKIASILMLAICAESSASDNKAFNCQKVYSSDQKARGLTYSSINNHLNSFSVYKINTSDLYNYVQSEGQEKQFSLNKDGEEVSFNLTLSDLFTPDFAVRVITKDGFVEHAAPAQSTYKGFVNGNPKNTTRLSIREDFFQGIYRINNIEYCIQPVSAYSQDANTNEFVFFKSSDIKRVNAGICDYIGDLKVSPSPIVPSINFQNKINDQSQNINNPDENKAINLRTSSATHSNAAWLCSELAFLADYPFYQKAGSSLLSTTNRLTDIFNLVQGNYDDVEISHKISEVVVDETNSLTITSDPAHMIDPIQTKFTTWGNTAGNFKNKFDIAVLYTGVDIVSPTVGAGLIGRSTIGGACTSNKYNIIEYWANWGNDYTSHRVDMAHEMGHNYNAQHITGSTLIMTPVLYGAESQWGGSASVITSFAAGKSPTHLDAGQCVTTPQAPVANFSSDKSFGCGSLTVKFFDESTNAPTSWAWDFGDGGTSTQQNPTHNYTSVGSFTVKLKATNAVGNNTSTQAAYIVVGAGTPAAPQHAGPVNNTLGTGAYSSNNLRGMYFQVMKDLVLESILVYPGDTTGDRVFFVTDTNLIVGNGANLTYFFDTTVNIIKNTPTVVKFNLDLKPGYYILLCNPTVKSANTIQDLYRNQTGITYPQNSADGSISIYNNIFNIVNKSAVKEAWYVGYDWVIQSSGCTTGIGDISSNNESLSVFPSPSNGLYSIQSKIGKQEKTIVEVYNILGEKIYSATKTFGNGKTDILDLTTHANGVYVVKLIGESHQTTQRIIKN